MEITAVKRISEVTVVVWNTPNGQTREDHALTCSDVPKDEFLEQFKIVEADLIARSGFGEKFGAGLVLTGISVTKNSNGRRQFVPSVKIDFGWGETGASMSLLLEPDEEKKRTTGKNVLTDAELVNIDRLLGLGGEYAGGERHQGSLRLEESA